MSTCEAFQFVLEDNNKWCSFVNSLVEKQLSTSKSINYTFFLYLTDESTVSIIDSLGVWCLICGRRQK